MFSIGFPDVVTSLAVTDPPLCRMGEIRIGSFNERFHAPMTFWTPAQYIRQWREGLQRVRSGGDLASALITSITNPAESHHLFWWVLYKVGNTVFFQNEMLLLGELNGAFDPSGPYAHIRPRQTHNEEGIRVSEWQLPLAEVTEYRIIGD